MKFSALFILISFLFSFSLFARETFEFDLGQKINILSDKAFRKSSTNEFEAVGNVVITHLKNTIYGEKAKINFTTGESEIFGNVRYIAPEMTLYGSKLAYNFLTKEIVLDNAKVLSDGFVVTGKKIRQNDPSAIYAEEAEYTTCKDCPESWSIYGKNVTIIIGKYIKLQNAFIKVKGVVAMYVPYIIFPIKQERETGLLFPSLGFSSDEGFLFKQPFFWAIDDYKDMTITPATYGDRGLGGELQYRQNIAEKTFLEVNSMQLNDRIYEPYKTGKTQSGKKDFRYFGDVEGHYVYKQFLNSHFYFNDSSDLDTFRDFDNFTKDRVTGTEYGGGGFLEGRSSLFSFSAQSYYNKNQLINDPRKFDDQYVQLLPKLTFSTVPYNILNSELPFLKKISFGMVGDYTVFKQNRIDLGGPIRNARRLNFNPYLDWQLGNLGPFSFSHHLKFDYQSYKLNTEDVDHFSKRGLIYETEMKFELEKVYGLSYVEEVPVEIDNLEKNRKIDPSMIGTLPELSGHLKETTTLVYNNSYRHSQEFKLKYYYIGDQSFSGNRDFRTQIESDDGQFDYVDALRDREYLANQNTLTDSLPMSNTIELQWNNSLIRKRSKKFDPYKDNRYLTDNFDYSNIFYFDASQGVDLNVESEDFKDKLTRLYVNTGISLDKWSFGIQEFYFHQTSEHKLTSSLGVNYDLLNVAANFTYNSLNSSNTPVTKLVGYDIKININDMIKLQNRIDYNIESKVLSETYYSVLFAPLNDCWMIEANYSRDLIDKKFGLLLYINYNSSNFTSINVK